MNKITLEKPPRLRGLIWKLTFGFVLVGVSMWFLLGLTLGFLSYVSVRYWNEDLWNLPSVKRDLGEIVELIEQNPRNLPAIRLWLKAYRDKAKIRRHDEIPFYVGLEKYGLDENALFQFVIFDENGQIIAAADERAESGNLLISPDQNLIKQIIFDRAAEAKSVDVRETVRLSFAVPIKNDKNNLLGGLLIKDNLPLTWKAALSKVFYDILGELQQSWFLMILGFLFCFPLAKNITRRLNKIAFAAESWSKGDFFARAADYSHDELGILARRLNLMANDLSETFELRQTIAAAEERNRIARDLHDAVKQQVFALAFQIGIAQSLLEKNSDKAKTHLDESARLIKQVQQELVNLIDEISPLSEQTKDFSAQIENLVADWSRQNNVAVIINLDETPKISAQTARTLYRIAQETISNAARHSRAAKMNVKLRVENKKIIRLQFADNGCGFDLEQTKKGFGLRNMRERAEKLPGGWLIIKSRVGEGTEVEFGCRLNGEK